MSPMQVWSNESQERYMLALDPRREPLFRALAERERCPYAVLGVAEAAEVPRLRVEDPLFGNCPVDLPMDETLARVAIDLSGRPYLELRGLNQRGKVGNFPAQLVEEIHRRLAAAGPGAAPTGQ